MLFEVEAGLEDVRELAINREHWFLVRSLFGCDTIKLG